MLVEHSNFAGASCGRPLRFLGRHRCQARRPPMLRNRHNPDALNERLTVRGLRCSSTACIAVPTPSPFLREEVVECGCPVTTRPCSPLNWSNHVNSPSAVLYGQPRICTSRLLALIGACLACLPAEACKCIPLLRSIRLYRVPSLWPVCWEATGATTTVACYSGKLGAPAVR